MVILQLNSARKFVGEAAHTLNLTEALRRAGHRVLLGLRSGYRTFEVAEARGLEPHGFHLAHRPWPPRDVADLRRLARLVREHAVQVIHAHRGKDHWLAVLASRWLGPRVPVVRTRHVVTPWKAHAANRWLARRTARVVCVSRAVEDDVRGCGLFPPEALTRIPGGIDLDAFRPRGRREAARAAFKLPAEAFVAVCVARFAAVKAHRVLMEAWATARAARPDAVLVLAGGGPHLESAREQAQALGLGDGVRFLGRLENERVGELLEAADAGVLASAGSEGFSRAVLEYMALGLPVVATRVGAVPDLVADGASGLLVPPGDPPALAAALRRALTASRSERSAWGAAGRARAEAGHGYPAWACAHEALYAGLAP